MQNIIRTVLIPLLSTSAVHAQQMTPYQRPISIADQANIRAQSPNCPGFTNGQDYPLGTAWYSGVRFEHGATDRYAFMGGNVCGETPRALNVSAGAPGSASLNVLLSSWGGCGTSGPDFLIDVRFEGGTSINWTLKNGVDYRDHNGSSCPLTGNRSRQVWSTGNGQHLDMLTLNVDRPGAVISSIRIANSVPTSDIAAPFVFGITLTDFADCNGDGVADYGQCIEGTLPDYNGNYVPDCCEHDEACVVGNYPVEWRVADGGNSHWYQIRETGLISWSQSRAAAQQLGGYLTTLTTASESVFVARLKFTNRGVNLGGYQDRSSTDFSEPSGGWRWVTGEPWSYTNWLAGEPNNAGTGEDFLMFAQTNFWGDKWADQDELCPRCEPHFFAVEWSADCNNDNIVDYGQILQGQLADTNTNGIPDICEGPTCHDADLYTNRRIDGADLAALLSEWGPLTPTTRSDFNHDGLVNGSDLAFLLSNWGPCPN